MKEQKIKLITYWLKRLEVIQKMQGSPLTQSQLADSVAEDDITLSNSI